MHAGCIRTGERRIGKVHRSFLRKSESWCWCSGNIQSYDWTQSMFYTTQCTMLFSTVNVLNSILVTYVIMTVYSTCKLHPLTSNYSWKIHLEHVWACRLTHHIYSILFHSVYPTRRGEYFLVSRCVCKGPWSGTQWIRLGAAKKSYFPQISLLPSSWRTTVCSSNAQG